MVIAESKGREDWEGFTLHEREKIVGFLQYLRAAAYPERTLAAICRRLNLDWASLYFCIGAGVATGWIERERIGRNVVVSIAKEGVAAVGELRDPRPRNEARQAEQ